jgi:hypothetical protein
MTLSNKLISGRPKAGPLISKVSGAHRPHWTKESVDAGCR